jgi:hypothetical protein
MSQNEVYKDNIASENFQTYLGVWVLLCIHTSNFKFEFESNDPPRHRGTFLSYEIQTRMCQLYPK